MRRIESVRVRKLNTDAFARLIIVVTLTVALGAGLGVEAVAPRYGQSGFVSDRLSGLVGVVGVLAFFVAAVAMVDFLGSRTRGSAQMVVPSVSQGLIWVPFGLVWIVAALLGSSQVLPPHFYWESLALVSALALLRFPSSGSFTRWLVLGVTRIFTVGSLLTAIFSHGRAFAPYSTWPGGWWPGVDRLEGLFPQPNTLGWIAAVAVVVELYHGGRVGRVVFAALACALLLLSGSRTASLALIFGLLIAVIASQRGRRKNLSRVLVWGGIAVAVIIGVYILGQGFFSLSELNGRSKTWDIAIGNFLSSPGIGVGPAASLDSTGDFGGGYAHNEVFQVMSDMGAVGLVVLLVHVVALIAFTRRRSVGWLGPALTAMWLLMFGTENILRFADTSFTLQIVLFQVALASSVLPRAVLPRHRGPFEMDVLHRPTALQVEQHQGR